jgi:hypothetical protein
VIVIKYLAEAMMLWYTSVVMLHLGDIIRIHFSKVDFSERSK